MKAVAIVSENLSYPLDEGFKKASAEIATRIASLGIATTIFARDSKGFPLPVEPLPRNKLLRGHEFRQALAKVAPEAILYVPEASGTPMSLLRGRMIGRQAGGSPVFILCLQRRIFPWLLRPFLRRLRPALALVLSKRSARAMEAAGIPAAVVPLGVDTKVFRPPAEGEKAALRQKYGVGPGTVLLHIGHITASRNLQLLQRALRPGRELVVVASTSTKAEGAISREMGESSARTITGFVENVGEIYRLADCYLFPTWHQTGAIEIPLSILEAMATNLPVVTTAFGGIPDIFSEGKGLFIASSGREFGEKIDAALESKAVATRELVRDLTWENAASQIVAEMERRIG